MERDRIDPSEHEGVNISVIGRNDNVRNQSSNYGHRRQVPHQLRTHLREPLRLLGEASCGSGKVTAAWVSGRFKRAMRWGFFVFFFFFFSFSSFSSPYSRFCCCWVLERPVPLPPVPTVS